jgi:hypothetical protein
MFTIIVNVTRRVNTHIICRRWCRRWRGLYSRHEVNGEYAV